MKKLRSLFITSLILGSIPLTGCDFITITDVETPEPTVDNSYLEVTDPHIASYEIGNVYDEFADGLGLTVYYLNPSNKKDNKKLNKTEYTYKLTDEEGNEKDPTEPFFVAKKYNVDVSYKDYKAETFSFEVNYKDVDATAISLDKKELTMIEGTNETLIYTLTPSYANSNVVWSSNNTDAAIVDNNGVVTAKAKGTATISVKSANKSASCLVTVKPVSEPVLITNISMVETTKTIYTGNSEQLSVNILPEDATNKVLTWTSLSASVATVDEFGFVTGIKAGTATIKAKANDGSAKYATCKVTIVDPPVDPTSIVIDKETMEVNVGETGKLTVSILPTNANQNKGITWTTSDKDIATVSNGTVTGVAKGVAIITATSTLGLTATCEVTVKEVAVTGVSLSVTSKEVGIGSSYTLTPNVSPENATHKEVNWSSSKETVATVDDTGKVTGVSVGTATITVTTVEGNKTASCTINVTEVAKDTWTIFMYICGADLESDSSSGGQATADLNEIKSVSGKPDDVNIVVETGGANSWKNNQNSCIDASKLSRFHLGSSKSYISDEKITYASMGLSSTLQSYLEWGINKYPAENYGLILWNHGGGLAGVCYDEKKNDDSLTNDEVKKAVKNAFTNTGVSKFEFIGYDACLMQTMEVAEFNSAYFNYQIASQESESGTGWDYDKWIDDLYAKKSTEVILKEICSTFITDNGGTNGRYGQTLSYLDLSKIADFKTAWESMASQVKTKITSSNKSTFKSNVVGKTYAFAGDDYEYFALFDAYNFLEKLSSNSTFKPDTSYITNAKTAIENLVKCNIVQADASNAHGICFYFGTSYNSSTYSNFTNWVSLVNTVGGFSYSW